LQYSLALSTPEGYQGYGPEKGQKVTDLVCQNTYSSDNKTLSFPEEKKLILPREISE
jgi:hypothetical protein